MSTLADELLQDFEDSGSENGERVEDDEGDDTAAIMGLSGGDVPMDDTDLLSSDDEADEAMGGANDLDDDDANDGKAAKNGKPSDLRSATSLVKTLDSVLEVRPPPLIYPINPKPPPSILHLPWAAALFCAWLIPPLLFESRYSFVYICPLFNFSLYYLARHSSPDVYLFLSSERPPPLYRKYDTFKHSRASHETSTLATSKSTRSTTY